MEVRLGKEAKETLNPVRPRKGYLPAEGCLWNRLGTKVGRDFKDSNFLDRTWQAPPSSRGRSPMATPTPTL